MRKYFIFYNITVFVINKLIIINNVINNKPVPSWFRLFKNHCEHIHDFWLPHTQESNVKTTSFSDNNNAYIIRFSCLQHNGSFEKVV